MARMQTLPALDIFDRKLKRWYTGKVIKVDAEKSTVTVTYDGRTSKDDEEMPVDSTFIAPLHSRCRSALRRNGNIHRVSNPEAFLCEEAYLCEWRQTLLTLHLNDWWMSDEMNFYVDVYSRKTKKWHKAKVVWIGLSDKRRRCIKVSFEYRSTEHQVWRHVDRDGIAPLGTRTGIGRIPSTSSKPGRFWGPYYPKDLTVGRDHWHCGSCGIQRDRPERWSHAVNPESAMSFYYEDGGSQRICEECVAEDFDVGLGTGAPFSEYETDSESDESSNDDDDESTNGLQAVALELVQSTLNRVEMNKKPALLEEEQDHSANDLYLCNREPFPLFMNVALNSRSDDEYLERLIDKALTKIRIRYGWDDLWKDREFDTKIYPDDTFAETVEKIYREVNAEENSDGLDFTGCFVNQQFKRQINEPLRDQIQSASHELLPMTRSLSNRSSTVRQETWGVRFGDDGEYVLNPKFEFDGQPNPRLHSLRHFPELFTLNLKDTAKYDQSHCWAVFKKVLEGTMAMHGITAKGYWEILDHDVDIKRRKSRPRAESFRSSRSGIWQWMAQLSSFRETFEFPKLKRSSKSRKDILRSVNDMKDDADHDSDEEAGTGQTATSLESTVSRRREFEYVPLEHLNLIYELLQQFYRYSLLDDKEKQRLERKERVLTETPLFMDHCGEDKDSENISKEYTI